MENTTLGDLIKALGTNSSTVYVAPLIKYEYPDSDYLYNLYKPIFDDYPSIKVKSLSVFSHYKPFFAALTSRDVIFHYHWLEFQDFKSLLGMPWKLLWIFLFKLIGGKIIWTIHNEQPHDQKFLKFHLSLHKKMARWASALHVHCKTAAHIMSETLNSPLSKFHIIPHPYFPAKLIPRQEAIIALREKYNLALDTSKPVALIFGQISHYKQIEGILADFIVGKDETIQFLIAGTVKKGNKDLGNYLSNLATKNAHIHLVTQFISDSELPYFLNAANVCLFNYKQVLTSGGVFMALSYNIPIIAPKLGCITELDKKNNIHLFETDAERNALIRTTAVA